MPIICYEKSFTFKSVKGPSDQAREADPNNQHEAFVKSRKTSIKVEFMKVKTFTNMVWEAYCCVCIEHIFDWLVNQLLSY